MKRKEFIKTTGIAAASIALQGSSDILALFASHTLKVGIIGVGLRGQDHLELLLKRDDVEVAVICDIDQRMINLADKIISTSRKPRPEVVTGDEQAWRKVFDYKGLDAVIIATPWEWHTPMILYALESGIKYVATEVVLGISLEDHWKVVRAAEKNQAQVMMLENVCYRRDVLAILNMIRQNVFGEIIHLQGGYQHDLREVKFNNGTEPYGHGVEFGENGFSEAKWRTAHSIHRNGDLYPTHGIGPIAQFININRGNRFVSLSSFASKSRGLHQHIIHVGGQDHKNAKIEFKLGDVVTTQINCANGETILLQHDTSLPRPYSLGFRVQGTQGIWMDVHNSIYIEGRSSNPHRWESAQEWLDTYEHPLWKKWGNETTGAGHGGMDFFVIHAFIEAAKRKIPTPLDVYDAATWSVISPLSEQSIELGNANVQFPDFTGGQWMFRKPDFAFKDEF